MPCRSRLWGHFVGLVFISGLATFGSVSPACSFEIGERFAVGDWAGHAQYDDDGTGRQAFSLCLISAEFDSGMTLAFIRKAAGFASFISDPRWQLEQYATYPLTVSIDRLWSERVEGRAVLHSVLVELQPQLRVWDALSRGRRLTVVTDTRRFDFVLDGSARALDRLERCFRDHSRAVVEAERNPFDGSSNPFAAPVAPPQGAPRPQRPSMQLAQLSGLLQKVVGVEFWVKPAAEVDASLEMDYVYGVGDLLTGFYWEQLDDGRSAERILSDALATLQENCSGPFVSGLRSSVDSKRALRTHGSHACKADDFFADATVIAWKNGYVTVFVNTTDMADAQVAEEIGSAIGTALAP
jgi:hypothetical protein